MSYARKDKRTASTLKNKITEFGIDVFMAHDDIGGGKDWPKEIQKAIYNCDAFLILLSKDYRSSKYTDQEIGIALAYDKRILPVSIDGTKPHGFINDIQSIKYDKIIEHIEEPTNSIFKKPMIKYLIRKLKNAHSFDESENWSKKLLKYENIGFTDEDIGFTDEDIKSIADVYLTNNQIYWAHRAGQIIYDLLERNENLLPKHMMDKIRHTHDNKHF